MEVPSFAGARWRKARSSGDGGCVEVAAVPEAVGVRDTKDRQGPSLTFTPDAWEAFVDKVRQGSFDL